MASVLTATVSVAPASGGPGRVSRTPRMRVSSALRSSTSSSSVTLSTSGVALP
ncbi:Uncharacterised protein [Bordetella pertussis]|nr:Uncharacterised protein [Bordetella pertussis]CFP62997.1 Uncharacterised protein [Bordetella pertussis]CFW05047.1 Uncharacterised protein [Bordetella pertussis]